MMLESFTFKAESTRHTCFLYRSAMLDPSAHTTHTRTPFTDGRRWPKPWWAQWPARGATPTQVVRLLHHDASITPRELLSGTGDEKNVRCGRANDRRQRARAGFELLRHPAPLELRPKVAHAYMYTTTRIRRPCPFCPTAATPQSRTGSAAAAAVTASETRALGKRVRRSGPGRPDNGAAEALALP